MYPDPSSASQRLFERAQAVLPGANSRHTVFFSPYPVYAVRGQGARIWDADGIERIDFVNNYSSLIHGHLHEPTIAAVIAQLGRLTAVGLPTEAEIALAEVLCERYPAVEKVRFLNSGSEAVMLAIKAARAYTGRPKIAKVEGTYHGLYDFAEVSQRPTPQQWGPSTAPASVALSPGTPAGVTDNVIVLPVNDVEASRALLQAHASELAGVLVDVMPAHLSYLKASPAYLQMIADFTTSSRSLFILDEVYSLRADFAGAHGLLGLHPHLVVMGKIIGGGFPIGALGGLSSVMDVFDPSTRQHFVPHGGTYNANPIAMVAGVATLSAFNQEKVSHVNRLGGMARSGLAEIIKACGIDASILGDGSVFAVRMSTRLPKDFRDQALAPGAQKRGEVFFRSMLNAGFYLSPHGLGVLSTAMTETDIERFLEAARQALLNTQVPSSEAHTLAQSQSSRGGLHFGK